MKKIIKPEDFPIEMNEENIDILARMALEDIISDEWREITFNILTDEENTIVNNRISEIQREKAQQRWNALSPEEQAEEKRKTEESLKEGPGVYRGNILQQEWDSMALEEIERKKKEQQDKDNTNT
jgi:hypothetical protein